MSFLSAAPAAKYSSSQLLSANMHFLRMVQLIPCKMYVVSQFAIWDRIILRDIYQQKIGKS